MKPEDRLIVSLDLDSETKILEMAGKLRPGVTNVKIGSAPFVSCGGAIIDKLREKGCRVFLDLKFHDIPNTVASAVRAAVRPGVFMINVHASGGLVMMKGLRSIAAKRAKELKVQRPKIVAVTILTSLDQKSLKMLGMHGTIQDTVVRLAKLAKEAGLDGVVCSPNEITAVRKAAGRNFLIVTPGVRPAWAKANDQLRVMAPSGALKAGSDYIVIGRPIIASADPKAAALRILKEMRSA
ncbi:MAG: orotidine-5'-phosphate decarboxylase [Candidatus Omnitrophota bacterium]